MIQPGATIVNTTTGEQITFLQTAASTAGALLQFESLLPAGVAGPPPHAHPRQEERFTVITGRLRLSVAGHARTLHSGETLLVPRGTHHTFDNRHGDTVRFQVQLRPALESEELFIGTLRAANKRGQRELAPDCADPTSLRHRPCAGRAITTPSVPPDSRAGRSGQPVWLPHRSSGAHLPQLRGFTKGPLKGATLVPSA